MHKNFSSRLAAGAWGEAEGGAEGGAEAILARRGG